MKEILRVLPKNIVGLGKKANAHTVWVLSLWGSHAPIIFI